MFVQKLDIKVFVLSQMARFDKKGHFNPRDPGRGRNSQMTSKNVDEQTNKQIGSVTQLAKVTPISIADGESQMISKTGSKCSHRLSGLFITPKGAKVLLGGECVIGEVALESQRNVVSFVLWVQWVCGIFSSPISITMTKIPNKRECD